MSDSKLKQSALFGIRRIFVFALVGGVLGVCVPQYFNYPLFAIFLPLGCMVLYTGFGYAHSVDSIFLEQFADSVYYLGFLLTLVALVVSLYFYQGDTLDSGVLVSNFSLALLTTIFGLTVRIYVNNFQIDTDLEILFPDSYNTNIKERLKLYKKLCKQPHLNPKQELLVSLLVWNESLKPSMCQTLLNLY